MIETLISISGSAADFKISHCIQDIKQKVYGQNKLDFQLDSWFCAFDYYTWKLLPLGNRTFHQKFQLWSFIRVCSQNTS